MTELAQQSQQEILELDLMNPEVTTDPKTKKAVIHLLARDTARRLHDIVLRNIDPYFFSPSTDPNKHEATKDLFNRAIEKRIIFHPSQIHAARQACEYHDEADLPFWLQFLRDRKIFCGFRKLPDGTIEPTDDHKIPMFINLFDIETESPPEVMAKPKNPIYPVVTYQASNTYDDTVEVFMLDVKIKGEPIPRDQWPDYCKHARECLQTHVKFVLYKPNTRDVSGELDQLVYVYIYSQERDLLTDVFARADQKRFDGHSGWFSNGYDHPYLIRRSRLINVNANILSPFRRVECRSRFDEETQKWKMEPRIKGVQLPDLMALYAKWSGGRQGAKLVIEGKDFAQTLDLKMVLDRECGFVYEDLGAKIQATRRDNPEALLRYCVGDAVGLRLLEKKCKVIQDFDTLRRIVGVPLDWATSNAKLIDVRLLRIRDKPLPSKKHVAKERVWGAIVYLPTPGMKYNVGIFDKKSLYPSIIRAWNLSPEMLVSEEDIKSGKIKLKDCTRVGPMEDGTIYYFDKRTEGLLPKAVRFEMEGREVYRAKLKALEKKGLIKSEEYDHNKVLETKYKYLACSYYGVTGYENFRLFSKEVRKSITFLGRQSNRFDRYEIEKNGYRVEAGDTDSVFVNLQSSFKQVGYQIETIITNSLKRFAASQGAIVPLETKYETFCKRILFMPKVPKIRKKRPWLQSGEIVAAKKRYAYVDENNDLYVVGMAPRRSSTPKVIRKAMLKWLVFVMKKEDTASALKLVRDLWEDLPNRPLNEIGFPKNVHKDAYMQTNPWIEGMKYMTKRYGKIFREDQKPLLIYIKDPRNKRMKKLVVSEKDKRLADNELAQKVVCITEDDTSLPPEIQSRIDWEKMRNHLIRNYFESLFLALGIPWEKVIVTGPEQQQGMGYWGQFK